VVGFFRIFSTRNPSHDGSFTLLKSQGGSWIKKNTMDIDKIIESLKDKDFLNDSVFTQNLEIIRHNLIIIKSSKEQVSKDSKKEKVGYGFHITNGYLCVHPGVKMIEAAEKAIMSCFRQLDIKPEASKKEELTPLMKLQKKMNG
jgi:hypothetical protein